jgi:hypothetical protein
MLVEVLEILTPPTRIFQGETPSTGVHGEVWVDGVVPFPTKLVKFLKIRSPRAWVTTEGTKGGLKYLATGDRELTSRGTNLVALVGRKCAVGEVSPGVCSCGGRRLLGFNLVVIS